MEGTNNLWDKKMTDLTVGDNVKMNFVTPIAMVGGMFVGTVAVGAVQTIVSKIRSKKGSTTETE